MFESWDDIELKFEVFLFMCGIMEDPSSAIDHMCEQFATAVIEEEVYLFQITQEVRSKKQFLNPLCNEHFYHVWELPLKRQSRAYLFGENIDWLGIGSHSSIAHMTQETGSKISSCHVLIENTCLPPSDVLQAISTLRQTITRLYIGKQFVLPDEACDNIPVHIFKIDPSATDIEIERNVVLPTAVSEHLGRQISTCYILSELWIPNQPFTTAEITDFLGTNRNLKTLNMEGCNLAGNKMGKLCQQFNQFSHLKECYLSENAVGDAVSVLADSIRSYGMNTSLRYLNLQHCNITPGGCSRLLEALGVCTNLEALVLSDNTIGGAFDALTWKPMYPQLSFLCLNGTSLTPGDIQTIDALIKENKIPQLKYLDLSYVNLDNLDLDTLEILESLSSITKRVKYVSFWKGDDRQDLKKIQERITTGISKYKSKNATN